MTSSGLPNAALCGVLEGRSVSSSGAVDFQMLMMMLLKDKLLFIRFKDISIKAHF